MILLIDKKIQQKLHELAYYDGPIDGIQGPKTTKAIREYQRLHGLKSDGEAGPLTLRTMFGKPPIAATEPVVIDSHLSPHSMAALSHAEPDLRRLIMAASKLVSIEVLDSRRGKVAQEAAFNHGFSKVHFGDSPHNYDPCIALDVVPEPLDWHNREAFVRNYRVIGFYNPDNNTGMGLAHDMRISARCLGDPNMDGDTRDGWDFPHYERFPWRKYAQQSKLYRG